MYSVKMGHVLDVIYKNKPSSDLKETFYQRRDSKGNIFNESGVWRFRDLLNFCQINTEYNDECSKYLVSFGWCQKEDNQNHTKCQKQQNS